MSFCVVAGEIRRHAVPPRLAIPRDLGECRAAGIGLRPVTQAKEVVVEWVLCVEMMPDLVQNVPSFPG